MKQTVMIKHKAFITLAITICLMSSIVQSAHRYLIEEYDEDYNYVAAKQATNAGARSDKKFVPVSILLL